MTLVQDTIVGMTVEDYELLDRHGFTEAEQKAEMLRLLPHVESMTEKHGTILKALEVDTKTLALTDELPDYSKLGMVWGLMDQLRQSLGEDAVNGEFTRHGKYKLTAHVSPTLPAERLEAAADTLALFTLDVN